MSTVSDLWLYDFGSVAKQPDVSIVIPAYGHIEATARCLEAVAKSLSVCTTTAEVLLIDDSSPEDFREIFGQVRGLRILRNNQNLGYLLSCNRAVRSARGKDIVLLNNDTVPLGFWLDHLRALREKIPKAFVVGARLVSTSGKLQESGGIVFKDGSGWNFGRNFDFDDPRCTYPREVDYCSAAAVLVEGCLARALGPFDQRYVPAYYEDTDLCFEARRNGGTVWIEPRAVVLHVEGLSNGVDTENGIKKHQVTNRAIFKSKWSAELEDQFPNAAEFVWTARTRGARKRILVFDEQLPRPDKDSGSLRAFQTIRMMRDLGFEVTFCPRNGLRSEPYTSSLEECGVEVLGPLEKYQNYLSEIRDTVSAVWVSRFDVATNVFEMLDTLLPGVKRIFDTVDIHHLRLEREEALSPRGSDFRRVKRDELEICLRSTMVVVVSEVERDYLSNVVDVPIHVLSNIHSSNHHDATPSGRGLHGLFVGSFKHTPNEDAVRWFCSEVLPHVLAGFPDFKLKIIGESPPDSVLALVSDHVEVHGWVENLDSYMREARVNLAPLRFGAGVKGKISHAMMSGLPTVTTSIGAEGMDLVNEVHALIDDSPKGFAASIGRLLVDDLLWTELSREGKSLANSKYGLERARETMKSILQ